MNLPRMLCALSPTLLLASSSLPLAAGTDVATLLWRRASSPTPAESLLSESNGQAGPLAEESYQATFEAFKRQYGKHYIADELPLRYRNMKTNLDKIRASNAEGKRYRLGLTPFADLSQDKFSQMYGTTKPTGSTLPEKLQKRGGNRSGIRVHQYPDAPLGRRSRRLDSVLDAKWDWRDYGFVTDVQDQGDCGSCYAFSAAGALEGAWAKAGGALTSISPQQAVDCTDNFGCDGGWFFEVFSYARTFSMCTMDDYPYTESVGDCQQNGCSFLPIVQNIFEIKRHEQSLLEAVMEHGPISVSIATNNDLMLYTSGVFTKRCGDYIDHAVLLVGFGNDYDWSSSIPYWLVKNSWGTYWGEEGYFRMERSPEYGEFGHCQILHWAGVPEFGPTLMGATDRSVQTGESIHPKIGGLAGSGLGFLTLVIAGVGLGFLVAGMAMAALRRKRSGLPPAYVRLLD